MNEHTECWKALLEKRCPELRIKPGALGSELTTFALGGSVALLAEPCTPASAILLLGILAEEQIPWRVLGCGSNVVIPDTGITEVVLRLGKEFSGCLYEENLAGNEAELLQQWGRSGKGAGFIEPPPGNVEESVRVLAFGGAPLIGLSRKLSNAGLSGLEFAAGIPGSVGGGVRMNAGAHGHSLSEVVRAALVLKPGGKVQRLDAHELGFGYRHSAIEPAMLVIAAEFEFIRRDTREIQHHRSKCLEYRRKTQPLFLPSAGSAFRNPSPPGSSGARIPPEEHLAAAKLLEQAGLKGFCRGGVCFSDLHSNWLVKIADRAKADDVHFLLHAAQEKIKEAFAIDLIPEIILW